MDKKKPVANPMLVGTIGLMKAEDTPEHRKMFIDELMRARFFCPVLVTPPPIMDENNELQMSPDSKIQFPLLSTNDGVKFMMAFTDWGELQKWNKDPYQQTFVFTFDDYANVMLRQGQDGNPSPAMGFVLNPFGENIVITKAMIEKYAAKKAEETEE